MSTDILFRKVFCDRVRFTMNRMAYGVSWATLLLLLPLLHPCPAYGADNHMTRQSIRGHRGIYVWVVDLDPRIEKDGLTESLIRADVILKLKRAGIRVLSKEKWFDVVGNPYLYVNANILKLPETKEYIYCIRVSFKQTVYLLKEPIEILGADTWSTGGRIGITPDLRKIRNSINELVDRFISAYLSVNPKD